MNCTERIVVDFISYEILYEKIKYKSGAQIHIKLYTKWHSFEIKWYVTSEVLHNFQYLLQM